MASKDTYTSSEALEAESQPENTAPMQEPSSSTSGSSSTSTAVPSCRGCHAAAPDAEKPLKPCAKCQSVSYCTRECQKTDFKRHKKECAAAAQEYAQTAHFKMSSAGSRSVKDAKRGGLQKWQFDT